MNQIPPALIFLAVLFVFRHTLQNGFVNWDDETNFLRNMNYRGLDWPRLKWMFTSFLTGPYQPLSWISLACDYLLWGMDPKGYHLSNMLLHACNAVLVYFLAMALLAKNSANQDRNDTATVSAAAFAALFFAVHPLRVESVAWITERRDVLSGFFYLATLLAYLRARRSPAEGLSMPRRLAPALGLYILSLMSKGIGITLPVALLILDIYPLRRLPDSGGGWFTKKTRAVWLEKAAFLVPALAAAAIGLIGQHKAEALATLASHGAPTRLALASYAAAFGMRNTIAPLNLLPLYEAPASMDPYATMFLLSAAAIIGLAAVTVAFHRKLPAAAAALAFYLATLAPVSGIVKFGTHLAADRYTYLPCLGWAVLAGAGLRFALERARPGLRAGICILAAAVILQLGVLSARQTLIWHDSQTLWRYTLAKAPDTASAHNNLGLALAASGHPEEAVRHYEQAVMINTVYPIAHYNMANALRDLGRHYDAEAQYRKATALDPEYSDAYDNIGLLLLSQNRPAEAAEQFRLALKIDPAWASARNNLGVALAKQGKPAEAREQFLRALSADPESAMTYYNLGSSFRDEGNRTEAIKSFERALAIEPDLQCARLDLALTLAETGRLNEANAQLALLKVIPGTLPDIR